MGRSGPMKNYPSAAMQVTSPCCQTLLGVGKGYGSRSVSFNERPAVHTHHLRLVPKRHGACGRKWFAGNLASIKACHVVPNRREKKGTGQSTQEITQQHQT
jgi:hypothetical protein